MQWTLGQPSLHPLPSLSSTSSLCPAAGRRPPLGEQRSSRRRGALLTCLGGIISEPIPPPAPPDRSIFPGGGGGGGGCGQPLPSLGGGSGGGRRTLRTGRPERGPCAGPDRAFYWPLCTVGVTSPIGRVTAPGGRIFRGALNWNVSAARTLPLRGGRRGGGRTGIVRSGRTDPRRGGLPFVG